MYTKIKNIKELRKLTLDKQLDCFIGLSCGARSSKNIYFYSNENKYEIFNEIDGSIEMLTEKEMLEGTNIGKALSTGSLYQYNY